MVSMEQLVQGSSRINRLLVTSAGINGIDGAAALGGDWVHRCYRV
jgi:hypothetical protein